jgi:hypothetical protein
MVCCHIQKFVKGAVMTPQTTPTGPQEFVPVEGMLDAPVIFFEICPTIGSHHGIINVLLAAGLAEPAPDARVKSRLKAVAHLRMSSAGATQLRDSIDKALLIGAPVAAGKAS